MVLVFTAALIAAFVAGDVVGVYDKLNLKRDAKTQTEQQLQTIDKRVDRDGDFWPQRNRETPLSHYPLGRPLRLLALDGGGVRGIVSLIMLKEFMQHAAAGAKPCDYFDLIGGTSTGGLIAIMLGRLRMTISQCISAYRKLAKDVFDSSGWDQGKSLLENAHRFSGDMLENAIKQVLAECRLGPDAEMRDDEELLRHYCQVFVVATPGCNVPRAPKLFRTYGNAVNRNRADECLIWEAARATACAPVFFPEIRVQDIIYSDGGLGYNNPAQLLFQEARTLWGVVQPIHCLLSIGTGGVDPMLCRVQLPIDIFGFVMWFVKAAFSCEAVHQNMTQDCLVAGRYLRLNPVLVKDISLAAWKELPHLEEIAKSYMDDRMHLILAFKS